MQLRLTLEPAIDLANYALIPSSFAVGERFVSSGDCVSVSSAYTKDYDAQPGQHPTEWARRFDLTSWRFAAAHLGETRVGGAAIVLDARSVEPDLATPDAALIWDIRVHPDFRHRGVGRALLDFVESHARAAGRGRMIVETQDINVAACRLYASAGYVLTCVSPRAYPDLAEETQLIWEKQLIAGTA